MAAERHGDVLVVRPQERLDHATSEPFLDSLAPHLALCRPGGMRIVMDLSGLEYVSSAGLRAFMLAAKQAKAQEGDLVIAGLQPVVQEIFEISRFTLLFRIFPDLDAALDALGRNAPSSTPG